VRDDIHRLTDCCLDLATLLSSSNMATHFSWSAWVSISISSSEPNCCMTFPTCTLNMQGICFGWAWITSCLVTLITENLSSLQQKQNYVTTVVGKSPTFITNTIVQLNFTENFRLPQDKGTLWHVATYYYNYKVKYLHESCIYDKSLEWLKSDKVRQIQIYNICQTHL